jgi:hypothetical protein
MTTINAQYNVAKADSLPVKIAAYQRRKMFEAFLDATGIVETDTLLDVGATSDQTYSHSNYLSAWYPHKAMVTAVGIDDASFLEEKYPGMRFVLADGRALPFEDASCDYAHSSAVLEHVGNHEKQILFLSELWRVARKGIFVTTPNRWFPVEFHTVTPLLHWLPPPVFRSILGKLGKEFFASENNLNLMSTTDLRRAAQRAGIADARIDSVSLGGWPTNLLLIGRKPSPN